MSPCKRRNRNSIDWEDAIKVAILIPLLAFAQSRTVGIIVLIIYLIIAAVAFKVYFSKKNKLLRKSLQEIDQMNGYEFEKYMKEMYAFLGYSVKHTPYVGDQGADLILKSTDGEKTAVQVKCYSGNVPNKAVQEVVASMKLYGCTKGAVVTNSYFTNASIELAKANDIELIDRKKLSEMVKKVLTILESREKQTKKEAKLSEIKDGETTQKQPESSAQMRPIPEKQTGNVRDWMTEAQRKDFDITEKRPIINIFKLGNAYYFKHFFDDSELFRELEPYYEKASYRFKMATSGERNKVMKLLDRKGFDPNIIEDAASFTVEIGKYQKYGVLLKNSVESYPLRDKILLVMKDMVWVEQALTMGAKKRSFGSRLTNQYE